MATEAPAELHVVRESAMRVAQVFLTKGQKVEAIEILTGWASAANDTEGHKLLAEALRHGPDNPLSQTAFKQMEGLPIDPSSLHAARAKWSSDTLAKLEKELKRPPVGGWQAEVGYNNNVKYRNMVFHIQTEDSGIRRPHIITHLFADGGRILKTYKRSYAELVERGDLVGQVRLWMKNQHKEMYIALREGVFDNIIDGKEPGGMETLEGAPNPEIRRSKQGENGEGKPDTKPDSKADVKGARSPSLPGGASPSSPPPAPSSPPPAHPPTPTVPSFTSTPSSQSMPAIVTPTAPSSPPSAPATAATPAAPAPTSPATPAPATPAAPTNPTLPTAPRPMAPRPSMNPAIKPATPAAPTSPAATTLPGGTRIPPRPGQGATVATPAVAASTSPVRAKLHVIRACGDGPLLHELRDDADIGREGSVKVVGDKFVALHHARLTFREGKLELEPQAPEHPIFVRLRFPVELEVGDVFAAGDQILRVEPNPPPNDGPTPPPPTYFYSSPKWPSTFRVVQLWEGGVGGLCVVARTNSLQIGRAPTSDLSFPSDFWLSDAHCLVEDQGGFLMLTDLGSRGGTFVRVKSPTVLTTGDELLVGRTRLRVELVGK